MDIISCKSKRCKISYSLKNTTCSYYSFYLAVICNEAATPEGSFWIPAGENSAGENVKYNIFVLIL